LADANTAITVDGANPGVRPLWCDSLSTPDISPRSAPAAA
jgi:hypothetical protein